MTLTPINNLSFFISNLYFQGQTKSPKDYFVQTSIYPPVPPEQDHFVQHSAYPPVPPEQDHFLQKGSPEITIPEDIKMELANSLPPTPENTLPPTIDNKKIYCV